MNVSTLCGKPLSYWFELEERLEKKGINSFEIKDMLLEIRDLRGKVNFYEERIKQMMIAMEG